MQTTKSIERSRRVMEIFVTNENAKAKLLTEMNDCALALKMRVSKHMSLSH